MGRRGLHPTGRDRGPAVPAPIPRPATPTRDARGTARLSPASQRPRRQNERPLSSLGTKFLAGGHRPAQPLSFTCFLFPRLDPRVRSPPTSQPLPAM